MRKVRPQECGVKLHAWEVDALIIELKTKSKHHYAALQYKNHLLPPEPKVQPDCVLMESAGNPRNTTGITSTYDPKNTSLEIITGY